ncbi:MAG TPA: NrfD/PsrC family molybdoenzyme membrane anchor subunit [Alphaproteobacteria bacterium]|nr:NrfD/PsrC family molybdoenzyme membrane anchor subunit [Alphaproteobacteria bacterium]
MTPENEQTILAALDQRTPLGYPARLLAPGENLESVTETIGSIVLKPGLRQPKAWLFAAAGAFSLLMVFFVSIAWLLYRGTGIWGINIPIAWGFAIVNFVWWVGIGHAGTFISAILLLLHQKWRTAINRFTETMTLCAISCAGMFPLLHLGRPWVAFWMAPYPDTMGLWPQFRSPLVWDMFAVGTYFTVSLIFWYCGLIPDLATVRDRATTRGRRLIYGFLALGWRNSAVHWQRHQTAYLLLAGIATPLVLSVHSVVGMDFAVAMVPGWHETIIPPYFVAGAIYSGFAMMLNILLPIRRLYGLHNIITPRHLNNIGNIMLVLGNMVAYSYIIEEFMAWYSGDIFEQSTMADRAFGSYGWIFWALIVINILVPQALWSRRVRLNPVALFFVALSANLGMWVDHFLIIAVSLTHDFTPSTWKMYYPTIWDILTMFGSVGLFLTLIVLFVRFLPLIAMSETREHASKR